MDGVLPASNAVESEPEIEESEERIYDDDDWRSTVNPLFSFMFEEFPSISIFDDATQNSPLDFYHYFVNDNLLAVIVQETNLFVYGTCLDANAASILVDKENVWKLHLLVDNTKRQV